MSRRRPGASGVEARGERQFGRGMDSFRAGKHLCAGMADKVGPGRAWFWIAGHALDIGDAEGPVMANLAKAHVAEAGTFIARTATEAVSYTPLTLPTNREV